MLEALKQLLTLSDLPGDPLEFLSGRLDDCRRRIAAAALRCGRTASEIQLLPVTKYVDTEIIRLLYQLGVRDFGENRAQEAIQKAEALRDLPDLRLHFIGHLQRNKVRKILEHCAVLQSLDSLRLLDEIDSRLASSGHAAPTVYVEVNISGERQKTGIAPEELEGLLEAAAGKPMIGPNVRGLMGMALRVDDPEAARPCFRQLRELRDRNREAGLLPDVAALSMGMSTDFPVAIEEGATIVRVGTILYRAEEA